MVGSVSAKVVWDWKWSLYRLYVANLKGHTNRHHAGRRKRHPSSTNIFASKEKQCRGYLFFDGWRKFHSRKPLTNGKSPNLCTASGVITTYDWLGHGSSSTLSLPLWNRAAHFLTWFLDKVCSPYIFTIHHIYIIKLDKKTKMRPWKQFRGALSTLQS